MSAEGAATERFRLDGRVAVVTGACGRLGPVWVEALLDAGARVAALDLPDVPVPPALQRLLERHGDALRLYHADVRVRETLEAARERCETELGPVRILVNNAGIDQPPGPAQTWTLDQVPARQFHDVLAVNVTGAFQAAQVFGAGMVVAGDGAIVNIGSLYATVSPDARLYEHLDLDPPFLKPPAYGASKSALLGLTRYLAAHWGPHGVRVNSLSPGGVRGGQDPQFREKFEARVPLGRMAEPADLGGPLVFLASPAASYVNGIDLRVDGGYAVW